MTVSEKFFVLLVMASMSVSSGPLQASGTAAYSYDARGRLIQSCNTTDSSGFVTNVASDNADNRQSYAVTGTTVSLSAGQSIYSPNNQYRLIMQGDGNLVLYGPSGAVWATGTTGTGANLTTFQSDGNLVVYKASGPVWASNTGGNYCAQMQVQNSGYVSIYSTKGGLLWQS